MTDVGVDVFAEWGVVPEDVVALSVSPFSSCSRFVVKSVVVSAFVECFLVGGGGGGWLGRMMLCPMKGMIAVH